MAMIEALKLATALAAKFIVLETDNAELFLAIRNPSGVILWEIRASVLAIKDLMVFFSEICFSLVKRSANKMADYVAKNVLSGKKKKKKGPVIIKSPNAISSE
ncbi:hypothetical protein GH714_003093 [Hevea brasiliensis]|uniref:RNase H type-1 domain-containing protein n=1 Tax=Hevea brasiliensis TaxID=3981 RepID=A0A6A6LUQ8_HEVBR|nr:hypothetical protein GH714_003093 [Hevea brasiliensis]